MKPHKEIIEQVIRLTAERFRLPVLQLMGRRRDIDTCLARWAAMQILRDEGMCLIDIGKVFSRGHDTVLHGLKSCAIHLEASEIYRKHFAAVRLALAAPRPKQRRGAAMTPTLTTRHSRYV